MKKESIYLSLVAAGTLLSGVLVAALIKRGKEEDEVVREDSEFFTNIQSEVLRHVKWCDKTVKSVELIPYTTREFGDRLLFKVVANTSEIFTIVYYLDTCDIGVVPKGCPNYCD